MQIDRTGFVAAGLAMLGACAIDTPPPVAGVNHALSSRNGLSINGLSINGLSINGLNTDSFSAWFNQNMGDAPMVMSYIVKCAMPAGSSIVWQNPSTQTAYTWDGLLGLAPGWSSGQAATRAEQQIISACLGAHANKYGVHIELAVEGQDANGVQIPRADGELQTYSHKEGCFFGNLFDGEGIFVGLDSEELNPVHSSPRACALESSKTEEECPPLVTVGRCSQFCIADQTHTYYTQCTYKGVTYMPLSTRIRPSDIYACGDKTCQFTEQCGTGHTADNCSSDCGKCD